MSFSNARLPNPSSDQTEHTIFSSITIHIARKEKQYLHDSLLDQLLKIIQEPGYPTYPEVNCHRLEILASIAKLMKPEQREKAYTTLLQQIFRHTGPRVSEEDIPIHQSARVALQAVIQSEEKSVTQYRIAEAVEELTKRPRHHKWYEAAEILAAHHLELSSEQAELIFESLKPEMWYMNEYVEHHLQPLLTRILPLLSQHTIDQFHSEIIERLKNPSLYHDHFRLIETIHPRLSLQQVEEAATLRIADMANDIFSFKRVIERIVAVQDKLSGHFINHLFHACMKQLFTWWEEDPSLDIRKLSAKSDFSTHFRNHNLMQEAFDHLTALRPKIHVNELMIVKKNMIERLSSATELNWADLLALNFVAPAVIETEANQMIDRILLQINARKMNVVLALQCIAGLSLKLNDKSFNRAFIATYNCIHERDFHETPYRAINALEKMFVRLSASQKSTVVSGLLIFLASQHDMFNLSCAFLKKWIESLSWNDIQQIVTFVKDHLKKFDPSSQVAGLKILQTIDSALTPVERRELLDEVIDKIHSREKVVVLAAERVLFDFAEQDADLFKTIRLKLSSYDDNPHLYAFETYCSLRTSCEFYERENATRQLEGRVSQVGHFSAPSTPPAPSLERVKVVDLVRLVIGLK